MKAIEFPRQKEMEPVISDLRIFMDIAVVSLQEAKYNRQTGLCVNHNFRENLYSYFRKRQTLTMKKQVYSKFRIKNYICIATAGFI
jgi:hypothetical protein